MSSADSGLQVQAAVYSTLTGAAAVTALVGSRIYDHVPQGATWPYVAFGPSIGGPEIETQAGDGWEEFLTVDTWSRKRGRVEARQIMKAVADALHDAELTLSSDNCVISELTQQQVIIEPDGVSVHGVQRFRFLTHP